MVLDIELTLNRFGFEKKILLLLSATKDCMEGGYTNETLHLIGNIGSLDRNIEGNSWKNVCPLIPSTGTLVVFERDSIGADVLSIRDTEPVDSTTNSVVEPVNSQKSTYPYAPLAVAGILGAIIGLVAGALIFRSRRNDSAPTIGAP